ncbi:hypothetical protein GUITHDRAFT_56933, partial [Guillardia theta CCMP2712]
LYVADTQNHAVRVIVYNPAISDIFASPNSCVVHTLNSVNLNFPQNVAVSPSNDFLYVADYSTFRIKKVSLLDGKVTALPGVDVWNLVAPPVMPPVSLVYGFDIAVSKDGLWLYVADGFNSQVRKVSIQDGTTYRLAGSGQVGSQDGGASTATFYYPAKLAMSDATPWLYVLDANSS